MKYWRIINISEEIVKVPVNIAHNKNVVVLLEVDQCVIGLPQAVQQALVQEKRGFIRIERDYDSDKIELGVPIKYEKPVVKIIPPINLEVRSVRAKKEPIFNENVTEVMSDMTNDSSDSGFWKVTNISDDLVKIGVSVASNRCPGILLQPQESVICLPNMTTTLMHQKAKGNIEIDEEYENEADLPLGVTFYLRNNMTIRQLRSLVESKETKNK